MGKKRRTEQWTHDGDLCSNFAAQREREREREREKEKEAAALWCGTISLFLH